MKHRLSTMLLLATVTLAGRSETKSRDFFAAGGIAIGAPATLGGGAYRIPIAFETKIVHSGQWIDAVRTQVP